MTNGTALRIVTAASVGLLALAALDLRALAKPNHAAQKGTFEYGARVQKPQKFLTRRSYLLKGGSLDVKKQQHAKRWLIEKYGNVGDDETAKINAKEAHASAKGVSFFGMPISVHAKIAPALAAVEKRILKSCPRSQKYTPHAIGGFRTQNTYRGVEISNHLLGIAIDIDPEKNPCCGCVDPWPTNPICKNQGPVYKRTALPKCWIQAFERFGFDWLGHDSLEDTMHFEFLGDPDKITK
jgi:hypothetical protein